jgi:hydroxyacylglutathione hydrolase
MAFSAAAVDAEKYLNRALIQQGSKLPRHYLAKYQENELIFAEDSEGEKFFIVITGRVGIFKGGNGRDQLLHEVSPGQLFGEIALINSMPRAASAIALVPDTGVIAVDKARFIYLVTQHPGFAILVLETLSRWLRDKADLPRVENPTNRLNQRASAGPPCSVVQIENNIWQFRSRTRSSNSYLFKGSIRTVLIDPGLLSVFDHLATCLNSIGVSPEAIDTILLTHEHLDHIGAVSRFIGRRAVAAHSLTATKIANGDKFAMIGASYGEDLIEFGVNEILREGDAIDTGTHRLRVLHTPGHSSGCISLLEEHSGILVTGDLMLSGGHLGGVFGSGNISDMIYSLERVGMIGAKLCLTGHGRLSEDPAKDTERALTTCRKLLSETRAIFDTLNAQDSTNQFFLTLRDLF